MHYWHDVKIGDKVPEEFNCIIEISWGSNNKYEIDKENGLIALDRANYSSAPYPFDYGFVPQTLWEDNDPLDVVVIATYSLQVGVLVKVRPIAVLEMIDNGESDFKILAVPVHDMRWDDTKDLVDLNKHLLKEYKHFFATYKELQDGKNNVEVGEYRNKKVAMEVIEKSMRLYQEKYGKK